MYQYNTFGIGRLFTISVAKRVKKTRYEFEFTPNKTNQVKIHLGKYSVYLAKRGKVAKKWGGTQDIKQHPVSALKEKLVGFGLVVLMVLMCFADSFN